MYPSLNLCTYIQTQRYTVHAYRHRELILVITFFVSGGLYTCKFFKIVVKTLHHHNIFSYIRVRLGASTSVCCKGYLKVMSKHILLNNQWISVDL